METKKFSVENPPSPNELKQLIFSKLFEGKTPIMFDKSKLNNHAYYYSVYGIPAYALNATKAQLINEGLVIDNEDYLCPTIKGEKFFLNGGFTPSIIQKCKILVKENQVTILSIVSTIIALLALFYQE